MLIIFYNVSCVCFINWWPNWCISAKIYYIRIILMNMLHVPPFSGEEERLRQDLFALSSGNARNSRFSPKLLWINKKSTGAFLLVWTRVSEWVTAACFALVPVCRAAFYVRADVLVGPWRAYVLHHYFSHNRYRFIVSCKTYAYLMIESVDRIMKR